MPRTGITIIRADGRREYQEFPSIYRGQEDAMEQLKTIVGGWVELVHVLYNGKPTYMVVNEEGAILQPPLPINIDATDIYHNATMIREKMTRELARATLAHIHGDVALLTGVIVE